MKAFLMASVFVLFQQTDITFTFLTTCINNTPIKNAEFLTNKGFSVLNKLDEFNTYVKGGELSEISFDEYLSEGKVDYINLTYGPKRIGEYNSLINILKQKALKKSFFYSQRYKLYVTKYQLNAVNYYLYTTTIYDQKLSFYEIDISKRDLEKEVYESES